MRPSRWLLAPAIALLLGGAPARAADKSPAKEIASFGSLQARGVMRDVVRGPVVPCTEATRKVVAAAVEAYQAGAR